MESGDIVMTNRGFTVIEVLSVIIILAVILTLALPKVSVVINNSKKDTFRIEAESVLSSIRTEQLRDMSFDPQSITLENISYMLGANSLNYEQVRVSIINDNIYIILVGSSKWTGLTAYGTMNDIHVIDNKDYNITPPVITIIGDNPMDVSINSTYKEWGAVAFDEQDGNVSLNLLEIRNSSNEIVQNIDSSVLGTFNVYYSASDSNNNKTTVVRRVNIVDSLFPTFLTNR